MKRYLVDYWNNCFNDLYILKPGYSIIEKAWYEMLEDFNKTKQQTL
ncbi:MULTISPECIES: hypothetical protein [Staphylococcus]|nr:MULTISPECIES: hypothetical protein [Staphylococcus]